MSLRSCRMVSQRNANFQSFNRISFFFFLRCHVCACVCVYVCVCVHAHAHSRSVMSDTAAPWTVACQAPLYIEFYRQEYCSGFNFLLQRIFPTQGSNSSFLCFLYRQADSLPLRHLGSIFTLLGRMEVVLISTSCRREREEPGAKYQCLSQGKTTDDQD